jgi:hypothetical protein
MANLSRKFCSCVKKVRRSIKAPKERYAIGICVKSVLQTRGKTLKRFTCGKKPRLVTKPVKELRP